MADTTSQIPASARTALGSGPRGPKPRRRLSPGNIMLYGTLIVVALYYLLPLWVMVMTSVKGMPEIRMGNIFSPPMEITLEPWAKAWATWCPPSLAAWAARPSRFRFRV